MKRPRNPLVALPGMTEILRLPREHREASVAALFYDLANDAKTCAERAWRKGPMAAAYWRATSTYAKLVARVLRNRDVPSLLTFRQRSRTTGR